jgi:hypothetical protein
MRCEDCRRVRPSDESGWVGVVTHPGTSDNGLVVLHYCPDHAVQFEADDPDVLRLD